MSDREELTEAELIKAYDNDDFKALDHNGNYDYRLVNWLIDGLNQKHSKNRDLESQIKQLEAEKEGLKCCGNCKFEGMHNYCNYSKGGCNMNSLHLGKSNLWQPKEVKL